MARTILSIFSIFLFSGIFGQDPVTFTSLKSKGQIPDEFTQLTKHKIEAAQQENPNGLENLNKKTRQQFYEMSNFGIADLLHSGQVCFNDTISNYVDHVLEEIKSKNHSIPMNVRIYTVKSPVVNAFTTDQGIIFINTGLLAQLENEAQLAFVLCHELVHYMENHVREGYVEDVQISKGKNDYRKLRNIDKGLASAKFSRKLETAADSKGLEYFLQTDYDPAEINGVFDVLLYSYLPFDEIPFDPSVLEVGDYKIPSTYFLDELSPISVDENEDDSKHTHPNIKKRRELVLGMLPENVKGNKKYIVSEEDFKAVRSIARYEVLRLQLIDGNYSEALYSAFLLNHENPENPLSKMAIGEVLFGTAMFANSGNDREVIGYYKKQQGNIQQVYYMLSKFKPKEITLLAARYNMSLLKDFPNNNTIENRLSDLFRDLVYNEEMEITDIRFTPKTNEETSTGIVNDSLETAKPMSKYDRIKASKNDSKDENGVSKYWAQEEIFVGCACQEEVAHYFELGQKKSDQLKYDKAKTGNPTLDAKSRTEQEKYAKIKKKKGRSLGIEKIVLVDPYYVVYDQTNSKNPINYSKSEEKQVEQITNLDRVGSKTKLDVDVLSYYQFGQNDVDKFNDFSLLTEWVDERFLMEDRSNVISSTEEVNDLVEKYGTKYFGWTGVVNTTYPRNNKFWVALISLYSVVGIPYGVYYMATPQNSTLIYFALFNIETGQLVMYENREVPMSDSPGILKSQYFDMFNQIKKKSRRNDQSI
jgi:hypothetical protein